MADRPYADPNVLRFDLWPGVIVPSLTGLLDGVVATAGVETRVVSQWWDTDDHRLAQAGAILVAFDDRWWVVPPSEVARTPWWVKQAGDSAPRSLAAYHGSRPLRAVVAVTVTSRTQRLLDADGAIAAWVAVEEIEATDAGNSYRRFRSVALRIAPDAPANLVNVVGARLAAAGATPARAPLAELVLGPGVRTLRAHTEPASAAAATVLETSARTMRGRLTRIAERVEPDDVHQARVALRRIRSSVGTFAPVLEPSWIAVANGEFRWLGRELGAVRDLHVLRERLQAHADALGAPDGAELAVLLRRVERDGLTAERQLQDSLSSDRFAGVCELLLVDPVLESEVTLSDLIAPRWRRLVRAVGHADADDIDSVHRARIQMKRLRYALEAVDAGMHGAGRLARRMARLQETVGEIVDAEASERWCRQRVESGSSRGQALALGRVIEREQRRSRKAQSSWEELWSDVSRRVGRQWPHW